MIVNQTELDAIKEAREHPGLPIGFICPDAKIRCPDDADRCGQEGEYKALHNNLLALTCADCEERIG